MEINNVAVTSQQASGGVNALSQPEQKTAEAERNNGNKEASTMTKNPADGLKEDYTAVSKDGDTLTLSENIKSEGMKLQEIKSADGKVSATKMTDASLSKCSGPKLRQLLQQGKISKQQYEKAMKKAAK